MGVRELDAQDVLTLHILPAFTAAAAAAALSTVSTPAPPPAPAPSPRHLMSCLAFPLVSGLLPPPLKAPNQQQEEVLNQLKRLAVVITDQGPVHLAALHVADTAAVAAGGAAAAAAAGGGGAQVPGCSTVYLPPALSGGLDLLAEFPCCRDVWRVASPEYLAVAPEVQPTAWGALLRYEGGRGRALLKEG